MDIFIAFLNGDLNEEIYMEQPEGFAIPDKEDLVAHLHRDLYGLKQASRAWYIKFHLSLNSHGFISCSSDFNLPRKCQNGSFVTLALYAENTILVSNDFGFLQQIKKLLSLAIDMVDLGELHSCPGI